MESEKSCVYGLLREIGEDDLETIRKKEGYPKIEGNIALVKIIEES